MNYTNEFILSLMENSYLDFQNLGLSNNELNRFINVYETRFKKSFITCVDISLNNLYKYDIDKLLNVFHNIKYIIVSNMNDIDNLSNKNISITVV